MGRTSVLFGVILIITLGIEGDNAAQTEVPSLDFEPKYSEDNSKHLISFNENNMTTIKKWNDKLDEFLKVVDFEPKHPKPNNINLVYFNQNNETTVKRWIDRLDEFLKEYERKDNLENMESCVPHKRPKKGKVCRFRVDRSFGPCSKENKYGYHKNSPCIFISLSKVDKWIPEYYNVSTMPEDMPSDLKMKIEENKELNKHKKIWVSCKGEDPIDVENVGPIDYYPDKGFSSEFFPYKTIRGYMSPFVAVHFVRPRIGIIMNIECKVWAHNIEIDRVNQKGILHFELFIDY